MLLSILDLTELQPSINKAALWVATVNLDPANDAPAGFEFDIDLQELVRLSEVTERLELGPNGGLMFCMDHLAENVEWLESKLAGYPGAYFVFDCPGQVELYTHHPAMPKIISALQQKLSCRLVCVNVVDGHNCLDPYKFIASVLSSLSTMLLLELPHINVLSKLDLVDEDALPLNFEMFTDVLDLSYLVAQMFVGLTEALAGVVEDFGLVSFAPLNITDPDSVEHVIKVADKAVGYLFHDPGES